MTQAVVDIDRLTKRNTGERTMTTIIWQVVSLGMSIALALETKSFVTRLIVISLGMLAVVGIVIELI